MKSYYLPIILLALITTSCKDEFLDVQENEPILIPEITTTIAGKQVLKVVPHISGWVSLQETIQPQYMITAPLREISWLSGDFHQTSKYKAPEGWYLVDIAVHPSGQVSAAIINVDLKRPYMLQIKIVRIHNNGTHTEFEISPLPKEGERIKYYPASLDRIRLNAVGEDVYAVTRWQYNEVEASRLSYTAGQYHVDWQTTVEPDSFCGIYGIIGGGYDNFRQGDRYFFVYSGVNQNGELYVAVNSHEELLQSHDEMFNSNLMSETDPAVYDFGLAILTKISPNGERLWSKLEGHSTKKRLLNMRVSDDAVYLVGRVKQNTDPQGWDAWILSADASNGNVRYESSIDIKNGDMFWDLCPLPNGKALAVGTTDYTQNPAGLSVSDVRTASAVVLDNMGKVVRSIELPQGPAIRGSEAMFVDQVGAGSILFAGAHNAPGTHAEVYSDGFIAVRDFDIQE
jgi:hypothetical protein